MTPKISYFLFTLITLYTIYKLIAILVNQCVVIDRYKKHVITVLDQNIPSPDLDDNISMKRQADMSYESTVKEEYCRYNESVSECLSFTMNTPLGDLCSGEISDNTQHKLDCFASRALVKEMYQPRSVSMNISAESLMERMANNTANGQHINYDRSSMLNTDVTNDSARLATAILLDHRCDRLNTDIYDQVFRQGDMVRMVHVPSIPTSSTLITNLGRYLRTGFVYMGTELMRLISNPVLPQMNLSSILLMLTTFTIALYGQRWLRASFRM